MTQSIEKTFLIDPLSTNNAIYHDSLTFKNEQHNISISNLILRTGSPKLNLKRKEVNKHLSELRQKKNISLIDHSLKITPRHFNESKHLNKENIPSNLVASEETPIDFFPWN